MSKLVIVESPHKATIITRYLGSSYDLTVSVRHIRDLPADKLSGDIKNDVAPKYAIVKGNDKLVQVIQG
jgi:Topoisomerase IA